MESVESADDDEEDEFTRVMSDDSSPTSIFGLNPWQESERVSKMRIKMASPSAAAIKQPALAVTKKASVTQHAPQVTQVRLETLLPSDVAFSAPCEILNAWDPVEEKEDGDAEACAQDDANEFDGPTPDSWEVY